MSYKKFEEMGEIDFDGWETCCVAAMKTMAMAQIPQDAVFFGDKLHFHDTCVVSQQQQDHDKKHLMASW